MIYCTVGEGAVSEDCWNMVVTFDRLFSLVCFCRWRVFAALYLEIYEVPRHPCLQEANANWTRDSATTLTPEYYCLFHEVFSFSLRELLLLTLNCLINQSANYDLYSIPWNYSCAGWGVFRMNLTKSEPESNGSYYNSCKPCTRKQ